jgi:shikimate kinase
MDGVCIGRRVAIVGPSGSGKTTLGRRLAELLEVPHVELDALFWEPGWTPAPADLFRSRVEAALAGEGWVVDGNYATVRDLTWGRAETLVWLDMPLRLVLPRVAKRTWRRARRREVLWNGNRERYANFFDPRPDKNLLVFTLVHFRGRRRTYPVAFAEYPGLTVVRLRSPRQLSDWLAEVERALGPGPDLGRGEEVSAARQ